MLLLARRAARPSDLLMAWCASPWALKTSRTLSQIWRWASLRFSSLNSQLIWLLIYIPSAAREPYQFSEISLTDQSLPLLLLSPLSDFFPSTPASAFRRAPLCRRSVFSSLRSLFPHCHQKQIALAFGLRPSSRR